MQVPDELRRCVAFLYCQVQGDLKPAGTAFFVSHELEDYPDNGVGALLTAHHVIAGIRMKSDDGTVRIRLNTRIGGATWFETDVDDWEQFDTQVDLAALHWLPDPDMDIEWLHWPLTAIADEEARDAEAIGVGDDVFLIGLFRNHTGKDRNEPLVRVGNIAAIPRDGVNTEHYGTIRAILIEARSIGGLSGSPVFVYMGFMRRTGDAINLGGQARPFRLLGLMHGHWDTDAASVDVVEDEVGTQINVGIGIVVPIEEMMRVMKPKLNERLEQLRQQIETSSGRSSR